MHNETTHDFDHSKTTVNLIFFKSGPTITPDLSYITSYILTMAQKRKTSQFNAWSFVINNYTEKDEDDVKELKPFCSYLVVGKEVGEKCGTPHLQGYVYMVKPATLKAMSRVLRRAKLFVSKGSDFDNFGYAQKEDLWLRFGSPPACRKDRGDLSDVMQHGTMRDVVLHSSSYQAVRMAEKRFVYLEAKRNFKPLVVWFYGSTGVGKSYSVHTCYPDVFIPQSFKWWEGYDADASVLVDDFRGDYCKFHDLLTLIDRYPYRVECKGGSRQLRAERMFFTSPVHPAAVYQGRTTEDVAQLTRRIDYIIRVVKNAEGLEEHCIIKSPFFSVPSNPEYDDFHFVHGKM